MTEEVFRIIIAVAVGLACLMFIVQAFVMMGILKAIKKIGQQVEPLQAKAQPAIENVATLAAKLTLVAEQAAPVVQKLSPVADKIGPAIDKIIASVEQAGPVIEKAGVTVDEVGKVLAAANQILMDVRPKVSEVTSEVTAITHTAREQVERMGDFLSDAGERAHSRLEQIDHTVQNTVGQVEQVGDAVKRTVMRPVREVNGIAAGISAAVSTLVGKPRKYSVDSATQDEEMFI